MAKKQVKIMLPEEMYQELVQGAGEQGLSVAAYGRCLIFQGLRGEKKNAKMEAREKESKSVSRVPDLF